MNDIIVFILKCLRHAYQSVFGMPHVKPIPLCSNEEGGEMIYKILTEGKPCMIARYGATELSCILNYLAIQKQDKNILRYIKGGTNDWWWNPKIMDQMKRWSGFFPTSEGDFEKFSELMLRDTQDMDILAVFASTIGHVSFLNQYFKEDIRFIPHVSLDSFMSEKPWTRCLKGRKVLVIHPFAKLIEKQYIKRKDLFRNQEVLPDFELRTIEAVQSLGGANHGFNNWFEALDWMKNEMDKVPYDVCLIGCGAYGFPLAAYAKRTGHQSVHIGGALQLLFGIKGKRWENPKYGTNYGYPEGLYSEILNNPAWVRPTEYLTKHSENVEGACYW